MPVESGTAPLKNDPIYAGGQKGANFVGDLKVAQNISRRARSSLYVWIVHGLDLGGIALSLLVLQIMHSKTKEQAVWV